MRVVPKTEFSDMSGVDLATTDEVLKIVIHKTAIGYFVPTDHWRWIHNVIKDTRRDIQILITDRVLDNYCFDSIDAVLGALAGLGE